MTDTVGRESHNVDLTEAARQLEQAAHDVRVAFDCLALDEIDRAHTHTITARAAVDAAEYAIRVALGGDWSTAGG
jgi:putative intracellular protease/amidase